VLAFATTSVLRNLGSAIIVVRQQTAFRAIPMKKENQIKAKSFEIVEPIGKRVLIRKDEDKKETKGGIKLPDNIEIPTITGRVVSISAEIETMPEIPLRKYDKVLFNPKGAIPVDFEGDNRLFVVEVENVVAVFRKS
jgi:chaperonin GroES